jgi:integrase
VRPRLGNRSIYELRRRDIVELLDDVEDRGGPVMADSVLAYLRRALNWQAARDDEFFSPIVRGMAKTKPRERAGRRTLKDDELCIIEEQAKVGGVFGAIVRTALRTAQRRDKVRTMRWSDITLDGVWHVPMMERQKGAGGDLVLPEAVLAIIHAQPRIAGNPYVFAGRNGGPVNGMSKAKAKFDRLLPAMPRWTVHDLRRTARSLMSRAGVPSEHAERVLGHVIGGVEGVYNRHS